jgi:hypothetical protein
MYTYFLNKQPESEASDTVCTCASRYASTPVIIHRGLQQVDIYLDTCLQLLPGYRAQTQG